MSAKRGGAQMPFLVHHLPSTCFRNASLSALITWEITKVLGVLCQEPGTETNM